jgi:hypothetical protein
MLCLEQEIKRESGEDPEQSRCCKFYKNVVGKKLYATEQNSSGRCLPTETSQKTCHACISTAFEDKALNHITEKMNPVIL